MNWILDWSECWEHLAHVPYQEVVALTAAAERFAATGVGEFVRTEGFSGALHVGPWTLYLLLSPRCLVSDDGEEFEVDKIFVLDARKIAL